MALWYGWYVLMGASGVIFVIFDLLFWTHARDFDSVLKCCFEGVKTGCRGTTLECEFL